MENKEVMVIYAPRAKQNINRIIACIEQSGYPDTAENFSGQLYGFGNSLIVFPNKYPICRHEILGKRNMRCAVFHKNYIFVYKRVKNTLIVFNVIHSRAMK